MEREFEEIKRQLEEDADREIEDMKEKYEQRLQVRHSPLFASLHTCLLWYARHTKKGAYTPFLPLYIPQGCTLPLTSMHLSFVPRKRHPACSCDTCCPCVAPCTPSRFGARKPRTRCANTLYKLPWPYPRPQVEQAARASLKGENGIMRKKFMALQKDIEGQKDEIKALFDHKKELYNTIGGLEKDISGLKREVNEQDETIGEKERRIYDLKKKNQELEKFKFVLDYKIKELKKQIEPREVEIAEMKTTIRDMDGELERYHKNTTALDLSVYGLKEKQEGLASAVLTQRNGKMFAEQSIKDIIHDIALVAQHFGEPKHLKEQVRLRASVRVFGLGYG